MSYHKTNTEYYLKDGHKYIKHEPYIADYDDTKIWYSGSTYMASLKCPGSIKLESETFDYALEGTRKHEIAEKALKAHVEYDITPLDISKDLQFYVDFCLKEFRTADILGIETFLYAKLFDVHVKGTIDAWTYNEKSKVFHLIDLKTGKFEVAAKNNRQLAFYATIFTKTILAKKQINKILFTIVQNGKIKTEEIHRDVILNTAKTIQDLSKNEDLEFKTGEHCASCFKYTNCPSYVDYIKGLYDDFVLKVDQLKDIDSLIIAFDKGLKLKPHIAKLKKYVEKHGNERLKDVLEKVVSQTRTLWKEGIKRELHPKLFEKTLKNPTDITKDPIALEEIAKPITIYTYKPELKEGGIYDE